MEAQAAASLVGIRTHELIDRDAVELGREASGHTEVQVADRVRIDIRCIGEGATLEHELDLAADGASSRVESAPRNGVLEHVDLVIEPRPIDRGASAFIEADILGRPACRHDLHQEA